MHVLRVCLVHVLSHKGEEDTTDSEPSEGSRLSCESLSWVMRNKSNRRKPKRTRKKSTKRRWSDQERQDVMRLRGEGHSIAEVAKKLDRTKNAINFQLVKLRKASKQKQTKPTAPVASSSLRSAANLLQAASVPSSSLRFDSDTNDEPRHGVRPPVAAAAPSSTTDDMNNIVR